ncbi:MAG: phosphoenolpyruvate carboxylase, partial [Rhodospirillales bacterium]|nr:phosphoenolpyruvate carboxylase [Rhodospirillales bacterium]
MQHPPPNLAAVLLALTHQLRERLEEDPFGNPVLSIALAISRRLDRGEIDLDALSSLVAHLRDAAFADRAARLASYVGGTSAAANASALDVLAARLVRPDPNDSPVRLAAFREAVERPRFACVFTAHPTFSTGSRVFFALAEAACGRDSPGFPSHRPTGMTLEAEFEQACAAIRRGR